MKELEVRQLRYFVAVAEELHFGRAAERLNLAQPPLSRAIRNLERQLGVQLFERTTRQVELTPPGSVLLHDARLALDAVAAAGRRASNAGRKTPTLRLALKADYDAGLLPSILDAYRDTRGALPVELVLGGLGDQARALREGRADVGLIPTPFDQAELDTEDLVTEDRVVAMAADDPLAARTLVHLSDLAGRTLPDGSPADQGVHAEPFDGPVSHDLSQILNLVELGSMVWFPPISVARRHLRPQIAYRPALDLPSTTLTLAWPSASRSRVIAAFVRAACDAVKAQAPAPSLEVVPVAQQA